jgi:hypothetical protein
VLLCMLLSSVPCLAQLLFLFPAWSQHRSDAELNTVHVVIEHTQVCPLQSTC